MAEKTAEARHHEGHGDADHGDAGHGGEDSKADLYKRAQEKHIPGRSKMNKEQLKAAIEG